MSKQKMGIRLQLATALQVHQTITQECSQHILCSDCYRTNPDGPPCGILYAQEIKESRKLKLTSPATLEDHYCF